MEHDAECLSFVNIGALRSTKPMRFGDTLIQHVKLFYRICPITQALNHRNIKRGN